MAIVVEYAGTPTTVGGVITQVRRLLQDTTTPYRHSDDELVDNFNGAMREAFRIRPDLFLGLSYTYPIYTTADLPFAILLSIKEDWVV